MQLVEIDGNDGTIKIIALYIELQTSKIVLFSNLSYFDWLVGCLTVLTCR